MFCGPNHSLVLGAPFSPHIVDNPNNVCRNHSRVWHNERDSSKVKEFQDEVLCSALVSSASNISRTLSLRQELGGAGLSHY